MKFDDLVKAAIERGASDILLVAGAPPTIRADGDITPVGDAVLSRDIVRKLVAQVVGPKRLEALDASKRLDFAFEYLGRRFRASAFTARGAVGLNLRLLPDHIPTPEQLGLPPLLSQLMTRAQGLVLLTGATGQGKTTTQASLIDLINRTTTRHIVTLEDPIEYVHEPVKSVLDQRELGQDFLEFHDALRGVVRQRPDVVLVGEMRDQDTMQATLTVAETGHLVLSTLHTGDAVQAIPRLVESFPPSQQGLIRNQLANVLSAVVNQRLVKGLNGRLQLAVEVLVNTPAVANIIREGHTEQLYGLMEIDGKSGNHTMNAALQELVTRKKVAPRAIEPFLVSRESRRDGPKVKRR